ncbi:ECF transporter S component [Streptomyces sp. 3MP-14]|uniref:ECF transporter S component n=1 Tax=Streptomyces mimosae TaxID=2586635 RepID=A0A5N6ASX1_9ACTN|nr:MULTISPECIES: ECF transporter S component [Streptomyces]KAB8170819.1 ECF transporter S component [Streptomyces mimosae]KAB8179828.1 ECF transporter S component [Streptomyces sp. 3MP-14]
MSGTGGRVAAVRLGPRSVASLLLVSAVGVVGFGWPLLAAPDSGLAHSADAPWLFALLLPLLLAVLWATVGETGLGAKAVAMLGVLAAAAAALRPLGAGTAGLQPMFFLLVLAGRVLGPGFGFVLGSVSLFASALLTGGVGPWLPFQMLAMGWVTMGAGLLPGAGRLRGRGELALLAGYGAVSSLVYGLVMNLQGWPYLAGMSSGISFVPGDPLPENLGRYLTYVVTTSLGWDVPRALLTATLVLLCGGTVLRALRRATRRAAFDAQARFTPAHDSAPAGGDAPTLDRAPAPDDAPAHDDTPRPS